MNKRTILASITLVFLMSLSLVTAQIEGKTLTVSFGDTNVSSLDPIFIRDTTSEQVLRSMYVGLTHLDPTTNSIQPALANSWTRTTLPNDTVVYSFELREDIPWVRYDPEQDSVVIATDDNGNPMTVTKEDVAFGILRALDPQFATEDSYALAESIYKGVDYLNGDATREDLGVIVNLNDVSIVAATSDIDLPAVLSQHQFMPQPTWLIEEQGMAWTSLEYFVSFGPYVLKQWLPDFEMELVVNPHWTGEAGVPQPAIDSLRFIFSTSDDTVLSYQAGEIDVLTNMRPLDIAQIIDDESLLEQFEQFPSTTTTFLGLNLRENFPTSNLAFRQALSNSIDRVAISQLVLEQGQIFATDFVPPSASDLPMMSENMLSSFNDSLSSDVELAQDQLEQAKTALGQDNITIDLIYRNTDFYKALASLLADNWQTNLGITVNLLAQDFDGSFSNRQFAAVWVGEWFSASPTSESYYAPFLPDGDLSLDLAFVDPNFETLFATAYANEGEPSAEATIADLQTDFNERVLVIPIAWSADSELTKPYIARTPSILGIRSFATWRILD